MDGSGRNAALSASETQKPQARGQQWKSGGKGNIGGPVETYIIDHVIVIRKGMGDRDRGDASEP